MKSTLDLLTGRILKAFDIDQLIAGDLEIYHKVQAREVSELDERILTVDSIFAGLTSAREQISRKIDDVLQVKKDLIRQREVMEVAVMKSQEDMLLTQDHVDFGADTVTLAKAHKVLFTQDDQLLAEVVESIDSRYLLKAMKRLGAEDLVRLKGAIRDVEGEEK